MSEQPGPALNTGIAELVARYGLPDGATHQLEALARLLLDDPLAPSAVRDPQGVLRDHLADSLVALELESVGSATAAVDVGSGAGLPGLPLAIALPRCSFVLLESAGRKCSFLERAVEACALANVEVVHARAEEWKEGLSRFDLALARALARLSVVLEYAAPLLKVPGELVVWRGQRDSKGEVEADVAAELLGLQVGAIRPVAPYPGARHRYLHLFSKVRPTPSRFPRRPGMAAKRPLGIPPAGDRRSAR